jgi:hypothetical protein
MQWSTKSQKFGTSKPRRMDSATGQSNRGPDAVPCPHRSLPLSIGCGSTRFVRLGNCREKLGYLAVIVYVRWDSPYDSWPSLG